MNKKKTQVLSFHFDPPQCLRSRYHLDWDKSFIKYLGILLPLDISKLEEINYGPIKKEIMSDINRWNSIPYLNISSRIDSIKMNILPRLLYLFHSIPIEKPELYFGEWDKILSRFIWAGKKPRIKYKTLQLPKDKGGLAFPCLINYYRAVKNLVGDPSSTRHFSDPNNPWIIGSLTTWSEMIKKYQLRKGIEMFKWFAYDSDLKPSNYDKRFKNWTENGLTAYCTLLDQDKVFSFQDLKEKFGFEKYDYFRYLQIRNFMNKKFPKEVILEREEILNIFQRAYRNVSLKKMTSKLYSALQNLKNNHTLDIKERWEAEGGFTISQEEWDRIYRQQWSVTSSSSWREFSWKNATRFFRCPTQKANYSNQTSC